MAKDEILDTTAVDLIAICGFQNEIKEPKSKPAAEWYLDVGDDQRRAQNLNVS